MSKVIKMVRGLCFIERNVLDLRYATWASDRASVSDTITGFRVLREYKK